MDTELSQRAPDTAQADSAAEIKDQAAKASALIGSEAFVECILRAMSRGARQAVAENAALGGWPAER
jgi:hypothetical protein